MSRSRPIRKVKERRRRARKALIPSIIRNVTVARARWSRGATACYMRQPGGQMDVIGFYLLRCGVSASHLSFISTVSNIANVVPAQAAWVLDAAAAICHINDDPKLPDSERERLLKEAFAQHDVKLRFTGSAPHTLP